MSPNFYNLTAIAFGGMIGTLVRYNLNIQVNMAFIPHATVAENLIGSFLLGFLAGWLFYNYLPEWLRLGLAVGLLGGFTTMSTMAADTFTLFTLISPVSAFLYLIVSTFGGIALAFIGFIAGSKLGSKNNTTLKEEKLN